jgi:hypothetical protein
MSTGLRLLLASVLAAGWAVAPAPTAVASLSPESGGDAPPAGGAVIDVTQNRSRYTVRGLFVNRDGPSGTLRYDLRVQRIGSAGSMTSSQSGTFETAPNQTDTLSTVTVNASGGADLSITLEIRDGDGLVDTEQRKRTVEPAPDG